MSFRIFIVLLPVVLLGCSSNFSLEKVVAGNGGALVDFNVAQFDKPPAAQAVPAMAKPTANPATNTYDFSIEEVQFRESSFLANERHAPSVRLIAKNRGYAPVSVTIIFDRDFSENITWDFNKSHALVVPPRSEMEVARFDPINIRIKYKVAWYSRWHIGDYTARHVYAEGYRLPFSEKIPARAVEPDETAVNQYKRNEVVFRMPANAGVLAARDGLVVRIDKNNTLDIVHDDSTIATYDHLGEIAQGIRVGKAVKAGDLLGFAQAAADQAYLRFAVWRPEQRAVDGVAIHESSVFQAVSLPVRFRTDPRDGTARTHGQPSSLADAAPALPGSTTKKAKTGDYDFFIIDDHAEKSPYLPDVSTASRIIAVNRGYAPVSVTLDLKPGTTDNVRPDVALPHTAVVPPQSELVLARLSPPDPEKSMRYGCKFFWQLGDFTTLHDCPENYRFPFAARVRAYAAVPDRKNSHPAMRHSVQFSLPAGATVLAARKGIVVRVKNNEDIDVLHDDATIATYRHLEHIAKVIIAGKRVAAGDVLGSVGKSEMLGEGFMQLTVWRPGRMSTGALVKNGAASNFHAESLPMKFCFNSHRCTVLTRSQPVSVSFAKKK
jgi:murein DD-endopeptidase MepM/ murein hydrolase activator NlpD